MIRIADLILSFTGIVLCLPFFGIIALWVILDSPGGAFYRQQRIGKNGVPFRLYKFRSMRADSDKKGLLTIGDRDNRITKSGLFLRRSKLDELPQLFNVFKGDMSVVGPRPEVEKYTSLYNEEHKAALSVRPGITDMASIVFRNETEILSQQLDPERYYIEHIMPEKIRLNMVFIQNPSLGNYFRIIFKTIFTVIST